MSTSVSTWNGKCLGGPNIRAWCCLTCKGPTQAFTIPSTNQGRHCLTCQYGPSSWILIWDSQEVTHPSTNRAQCCLICELGPWRPELGPWGWGDGWMDGWTDGWKFSPVFYSTGLCPLWVRCPASLRVTFKNEKQGMGTADHMISLDYLLIMLVASSIFKLPQTACTMSLVES